MIKNCRNYRYGSIVTHYKWMKWLTHTIKKYYADSIIVVGNSVGGSCLDVFMRNAPADIVVIGEGEHSCLDVLDAIKSNKALKDIAGIAYRTSKGDIRRNAPRVACDINKLPAIDWDLFDVEEYLAKSQGTSFGVEGNKVKTMPISTARGCAFKCTFCHYVFWDDPYRIRSPESVIEEIRQLINKYAANYFNFWDDLSFASLPQVERMIDAILASGLKFKWSAAVRTDLFGKDKWSYDRRLALAKRMKQAGCTAVGYSLESGNRDILKMMDKYIEPSQFKIQVNILKEAGIISNTSVVIGCPAETKDTIRQTFLMCLECGVHPSIGFLLPLPSTGMYGYAKKHGYIVDEDRYLDSITERQDICLNMTNLSDEEILTEIRVCSEQLSANLGLGLNSEELIRTGGYKKHTNIKKQTQKIPLKRIKNDVTFNYSNANFEMQIDE